MSQSRHIIDNNGKFRIDYLGKFENMESDLKIILNKIGFKNILHKPFKKNSKKHDNYETYYNNNTIIEKVNNLLKEDLENFDYQKINNM
jgi:hypothetical protein